MFNIQEILESILKHMRDILKKFEGILKTFWRCPLEIFVNHKTVNTFG